MSKRRTNKNKGNGKDIRFALVPRGVTACKQCLMHASRGFVYNYEFNPHGHKNHNCHCKFIPGINGETSIEGYEPSKFRMLYENKGITTKDDVLAGVVRGEPMSFEEADSWNVNPLFEDSESYRNNCQSCVVVYEARRRGFDVEVLPFNKNSFMGELSENTTKAWIDPKTGDIPSFTPLHGIKNEEMLLSRLSKTIKNEERYCLQFNTYFGDGHIISVETVEDGALRDSIRVYDPQTGITCRGYSALDFFRKVIDFSYQNIGILRTDNMDFNKEKMIQIMKAKV